MAFQSPMLKSSKALRAGLAHMEEQHDMSSPAVPIGHGSPSRREEVIAGAERSRAALRAKGNQTLQALEQTAARQPVSPGGASGLCCPAQRVAAWMSDASTSSGANSPARNCSAWASSDASSSSDGHGSRPARSASPSKVAHGKAAHGKTAHGKDIHREAARSKDARSRSERGKDIPGSFIDLVNSRQDAQSQNDGTSQRSQEAGAATTMMVRNLPAKVSQQEVQAELHRSGFLSSCTFLYKPIDFYTQQGSRYAFVDFKSAGSAVKFKAAWHRSQRFGMTGRYKLDVTEATVQGFSANIKQWIASGTARITNPDYQPLILPLCSADGGPPIQSLEADGIPHNARTDTLLSQVTSPPMYAERQCSGQSSIMSTDAAQYLHQPAMQFTPSPPGSPISQDYMVIPGSTQIVGHGTSEPWKIAFAWQRR